MKIDRIKNWLKYSNINKFNKCKFSYNFILLSCNALVSVIGNKKKCTVAESKTKTMNKSRVTEGQPFSLFTKTAIYLIM